MQQITKPQQRRLLWLLLLFSLAWLLSLFSVPAIAFFGRNAGNRVFASVTSGDLMTPGFGLDLLLFALTLTCLYLMTGAIAWAATTLIARRHRFQPDRYLLTGLLAWSATIAWFSIANTLSHPRSQHGALIKELLGPQGGEWALLPLGALLGAFYLYALSLLLRALLRRLVRSPRSGALPAIGLAGAALFWGWSHASLPQHGGARPDPRPNVIFIGIDSLRPDQSGFFGAADSKTPAIDRFLRSASVFPDTTTPLARTFPAWISILTGKYPRHTGARYNLINPERLAANEYLAERLRRAGYQTMIAMDERRFANIGARYGFETETGPRMGAGDFILASITDTPLSNFLLGTRLGDRLFPYSRANRGVLRLYRPDQFSEQIEATLQQRPGGAPLFLVSHLCLPHWPYTWGEPAAIEVDPAATDPAASRRMAYYQRAVRAADRQFARLMTSLEQQGLLNNTIVVLLSDHGESQGESAADQPDASAATQPYNTLAYGREWGHGTDILQQTQTRVLLAMKRYGGTPFHLGKIPQRASLIDLAPTLYELLGIPAETAGFDGVSLAPWLAGPLPKQVTERFIFQESGFSIPAIRNVNPRLDELMRQGLRYYAINRSSGLLEVKADAHEIILQGKQRGVSRGDWLLMSTAAELQGEPDQLTLLNQRTREATTDLSSPLAASAPVGQMRAALADFYGAEVRLGNKPETGNRVTLK